MSSLASTGGIAAAFVINRMECLPEGYNVLEACDRAWLPAVKDLRNAFPAHSCAHSISASMQRQSHTSPRSKTVWIGGLSEKPKGNFHQLGQRKVAIFRDGNQLILQIGEKKWNLSSQDVVLRYSHNFSKKVTVFEVELDGENFSIEYDAWWADIPSFEPVEPEMDEDEDFMGYIYAVWMNKTLQNNLISSWS